MNIPASVQVFAASLIALCVLVCTGHWAFGIAVFCIAALMASAMVAGKS